MKAITPRWCKSTSWCIFCLTFYAAQRTGGSLTPDGDNGSFPSTYVLVHGANHGAWCWSRVAGALCAQGHRVFTPTFTSQGERKHLLSPTVDSNTFVRDVSNVLESEELNDVVLVGHSFGGFVITGVADAMPERIRHLCFLDAGIPEEGGSSVAKMFPKDLWEERLNAAVWLNGTAVLPVPPPSYFHVTDPVDAAWLERRLTPMPVRAYESVIVLRNPLGNRLPCTYVHCNAPVMQALEGQAERAKAMGWKYVELNAGHDIMITAPKQVVDLLLELV